MASKQLDTPVKKGSKAASMIPKVVALLDEVESRDELISILRSVAVIYDVQDQIGD